MPPALVVNPVPTICVAIELFLWKELPTSATPRSSLRPFFAISPNSDVRFSLGPAHIASLVREGDII